MLRSIKNKKLITQIYINKSNICWILLKEELC